MSKVRKILKNKDAKRIIENFFSLSVLNSINYLFPLILIPYLTRTLGVERFGLYSFSLAIIQYCSLLVSYGFDFSATKYVAINRNNNIKISEIFSTVTLIRFFIALICVLLLLMALLFINKMNNEFILYFYGFGIFIGQSLTPIWLFQGMEKMKFVTIINFVSKLSTAILIFIFLKTESDYIYVNLYYSIGFLIAALLSNILAIYIFKIKFVLPKKGFLILQIKDGWHIFLSTVFMSLYRQSNTVILGAFTNYTYVGYYSAAEKLIKAMQSIVNPITKALYPYFGRNLNILSNKKSAFKKFLKFGKYYAVVLVVFVFIVLFTSEFLITSFLGHEFLNAILNIKIMSSVILFGGLNYFLGIVGLVNLGYEKEFTYSVMIAGIINVVSCFIFVQMFLDKGASLSLVIGELVLFVLILNQYRKNKLCIY